MKKIIESIDVDPQTGETIYQYESKFVFRSRYNLQDEQIKESLFALIDKLTKRDVRRVE